MKTLLILVDGMRPDALANCKAAQKVMERAVYTLHAQTVMPSVTLPCHVSLFFSMIPEHHGTQSNTYTPPKRPILSLFDVLAIKKRTLHPFTVGDSCVTFAIPHPSITPYLSKAESLDMTKQTTA